MMDTLKSGLTAVIEWAWETWRDWWLLIIIIVAIVIGLYAVTKPGWDQLAQGKPFFLSEFEGRNKIVQECLESELYTREECILLAVPYRSR
jgi:hypothetical protein